MPEEREIRTPYIMGTLIEMADRAIAHCGTPELHEESLVSYGQAQGVLLTIAQLYEMGAIAPCISNGLGLDLKDLASNLKGKEVNTPEQEKVRRVLLSRLHRVHSMGGPSCHK